MHVVCNNAGIGSGSEGQIWEHHVNDWRWSLDVNVMGVVNGINAFVPDACSRQDEEGHVVNTTSGNGGFTPLINSAVYATTKAAVTTITECLWGQLREIGAKVERVAPLPVDAHARHAQHRHLATRREPARQVRPARRAAEGGSRQPHAVPASGPRPRAMDVPFAPLSEVADICFEGIRDDVFWITAPSAACRPRRSRPAPTSQIEMTPPDYLVAGEPDDGEPGGQEELTLSPSA